MAVSLSPETPQAQRLFSSRDLPQPPFASYKPAKEIKGGHRSNVRCLGWSTDARRLASAGGDKTVRVWTPERSLEVRTSIELRGHTDSVEALTWDPTHPERVATASLDRTVRVWDIRSGNAAFTTHTPGANINLAYHPKGHLIAVGNRSDVLSLIDVRAGGKILGTIRPSNSKEEINEMSWNNSGSIFVATTGTGYVRILDARTHNDVDPPPTARESASATVASAAKDTSIAGSQAMETDGATSDSTTTQANGRTTNSIQESIETLIPWNPVHTLVAHTATVFCTTFDPLGRYLVTGGADSTIGCWSIPEFTSTWMMSGSDLSYPPRSLAFSHDGEFIASGGEDSFVWIGSSVDGSTIYKVPTTATINTLAWNPARYLLAYAGEEKPGQEGTIRIWGL